LTAASLVEIDEDLSFYEGAGEGPNVAKVKEALKEELKQQILRFGIPKIKHWDREHFYFQAPGGQVFRLVGSTEDMSK
jgi:hypothetical protein